MHKMDTKLRDTLFETDAMRLLGQKYIFLQLRDFFHLHLLIVMYIIYINAYSSVFYPSRSLKGTSTLTKSSLQILRIKFV